MELIVGCLLAGEEGGAEQDKAFQRQWVGSDSSERQERRGLVWLLMDRTDIYFDEQGNQHFKGCYSSSYTGVQGKKKWKTKIWIT